MFLALESLRGLLCLKHRAGKVVYLLLACFVRTFKAGILGLLNRARKDHILNTC